MTDSRGDVRSSPSLCSMMKLTLSPLNQVAYLMADISNVKPPAIKELYERLESLSCTPPLFFSLPLTSYD